MTIIIEGSCYEENSAKTYPSWVHITRRLSEAIIDNGN